MTLVRSVYGDRLIVFSSFLFSRSFDARRHTLKPTVPCLQISSEDNSHRATSGNAFEGNSLSSSIPSSRWTPDFSWTKSSRQESTSRHVNDAGDSLRPVGGQDDAEVTSSGCVEVSCADDISSIIIEDANRLAALYSLEVLMPNEQCRAHLPSRGYVTISKFFLKFGL